MKWYSWSITTILVLLVLLLIPIQSVAGNLLKDLDLNGYLENRFFLLNHLTESWNKLKKKFELGDYNRLRLHLTVSPAPKVRVFAAVDLFTFSGFIDAPWGTQNHEMAATGNETKATTVLVLDRAYVDLYFKKVDLSIGKQRIAVGVSYLWAPLDLFNRLNIMEPKEEKPGTTAIKGLLSLGINTTVMAVWAPGDDLGTSTLGWRLQTQRWGIDMGATVIYGSASETTVYGLDGRGEWGIGWWLEGGYFISPGQKALKWVLGFDYTFALKRGLYWLNEFFYDGSGTKDFKLYDFTLLATGKRFTLARHYLFSLLKYSINDFWVASLSYMGNWDDGSFILNPTILYEVTQNVTLSTGLYIPLGNRAGEWHQAKNNLFFLWLKVNF